MANARLSRFTWTVFFYTVPVILFGAFVRAGLHGDGCGANWPGCNGASILPKGTNTSELIEFTHRGTSSLIGFLLLFLAVWTFRAFTAGHPARKAAVAALAFVATEVAIGGVLVTSGWVKLDTSIGRVFMGSFHLVNTFFLLGSIVLLAHFAGGGERAKFKCQGAVGTAVVIGLIGLVLLGITGAISALGDTIFPVSTLAEGLQRDIAANAHPAERLRMLHPLIATSVGLFLLFACGLIAKNRPDLRTKKLAKWVVVLFAGQFAFGLANLLALAPIWMQIVHLAWSDAIWVTFVLLGASALAVSYATERSDEAPVGAKSPLNEGFLAKNAPVGAKLKAYIALTKPRVVSLLVFVSLAAMFVAQGGWPGFLPLLLVALGGYMAAGSANTFNMVYERDLDGAMERTSHRPTITHMVSTAEALTFGFLLAFGSFAILWSAFNLLAAMMAMCGLLFYFFIYTMALKRRTPQNIVIGGAAGAFPPLVGYAAVTGRLDPIAWYLFGIIFLWTPVHFWALALMIKDDYAKAGVPMLPVVKGDRHTVVQIGVYTLLTAVVTVMPLFQGQVGWVYLIGASLLNLGLIAQSVQLIRHTDRPHAKSLFKYSMVYLALLFVAIAVDKAVLPS